MNENKAVHILKNSWKILKKSFSDFGSNRPMIHAGTTAYFAIFSIVPMLILIIAVFGIFVDDTVIRNKLFNEINALLGDRSSELLKEAINNYEITENTTLGSIVGIAFFLFFATTLFSILQDTMNYIWRIRVKSSFKMNLLNIIKARFFSFGMILSLGFVLLASLLIDVAISFLKDFLSTYFTEQFVILAQLFNYVLSFGIITSIFALIFRYLPDVHVRWSSGWFAAFFTSLFFILGKFAIGFLIGRSDMGAIYGAAGSIIVLLMWVYYVSLIFYFGVELSCQHAKFYKHINKPVHYAERFEIVQENPDKED